MRMTIASYLIHMLIGPAIAKHMHNINLIQLNKHKAEVALAELLIRLKEASGDFFGGATLEGTREAHQASGIVHA